MRKMRRWSREEIDQLYNLYPELGGIELAPLMNRDAKEIRQKARRLGIHVTQDTKHRHRLRSGGRIKHRGYVFIHLQPDDFFYPMASKGRGYVQEHRLVMAHHLKRCLLPWEIVHHKNGIKDDNRLENLELFTVSSKHTPYSIIKQRVKVLEKRVAELEKENKLLRWQLKQVMEVDHQIRH